MASRKNCHTASATRRDFLKSASATAATAALMSSVKAAFPGGVFAQAAGPEVTKAVLGYIALIDASALVIAKEKGQSSPNRSDGRPRDRCH